MENFVHDSGEVVDAKRKKLNLYSPQVLTMSSEYERIYLNESKMPGRMRIADSGLGWKAQAVPGSTTKTEPYLLPSEEISTTQWSRGCRGYEILIDTKNRGIVVLDGFSQDDFNGLKNELERYLDITLESREHALRGWNWGRIQLARNDIVFSVGNKPDFEIPYKRIGNTNMTGKNEVSVEMDLVSKTDVERAGDELVEVKFFLPGNVANDKSEENDDGDAEADAKDTKAMALEFYEDLKEKADLGQVSGEMIVSFGEILFLTPRGRYDIDMYDTFLRLRGKTYDYKVQYKQIQRIFSLPKGDGIHQLMILQVDPPLRQGQTKYSFLTVQFETQEELEVELNLDDDEYEKNWKTRLNKTYSSSTAQVIANVFKGFTERRVVSPGSFTTKDGYLAISCSVKANEGHLYPLEKCMLFVTKPTILIPYSEVSEVEFSRVDTAGLSKTFDMDVNLKYGGGSHSFSNIDRGEQPLLEAYFTAKGLRVKNDEKIAKEMMAAALADDDDGDVDMGSADEDSPDEDFKLGDEDDDDEDVDEEYDSEAGSDSGSDSGSGSGSDEVDGNDDEPEKKKQKS